MLIKKISGEVSALTHHTFPASTFQADLLNHPAHASQTVQNVQNLAGTSDRTEPDRDVCGISPPANTAKSWGVQPGISEAQYRDSIAIVRQQGSSQSS